jgi:hypothetical protein
MAEKAKNKELEKGMYNCEMLKGDSKGEKVVYHSSTAETLEAKGFVKVLDKVKVHVPKTMKQ